MNGPERRESSSIGAHNARKVGNLTWYDFFEDLLHLPAPNAPSARNPCEDQVASKQRIHLQVRYAASASPTPIQTLSATSAISAVVAASLPSAATVSAHVSTGTMNTLVEETVASTLPPTTDSTKQDTKCMSD
ncbi:hypothetical protein PC128_g3422 [Phytophthora cactorum]|nr:hypothetical protein PC128_g3422 [Phytophthora cactorum]